FFFHAEDGIRDFHVTGVQTCALPIFRKQSLPRVAIVRAHTPIAIQPLTGALPLAHQPEFTSLASTMFLRSYIQRKLTRMMSRGEIGRASCRERGESSVVGETYTAKKQ